MTSAHHSVAQRAPGAKRSRDNGATDPHDLDGNRGSRRVSKAAKPANTALQLLTREDLLSDLSGSELKLLWPDDGSWWEGEVVSMDLGRGQTTIYYPSTQEEEVVDLRELVDKGEVAWGDGDASPPPSRAKSKSSKGSGKKGVGAGAGHTPQQHQGHGPGGKGSGLGGMQPLAAHQQQLLQQQQQAALAAQARSQQAALLGHHAGQQVPPALMLHAGAQQRQAAAAARPAAAPNHPQQQQQGSIGATAAQGCAMSTAQRIASMVSTIAMKVQQQGGNGVQQLLERGQEACNLNIQVLRPNIVTERYMRAKVVEVVPGGVKVTYLDEVKAPDEVLTPATAGCLVHVDQR